MEDRLDEITISTSRRYRHTTIIFELSHGPTHAERDAHVMLLPEDCTRERLVNELYELIQRIQNHEQSN